jgi:cob(I)alamin adenosyltransferase
MQRALLVLIVMVGVAASGLKAGREANASNARTDALKALDDSSAQLAQLEKIHADYVQAAEKLVALYGALDKKAAAVGSLAAQSQASSSQQLLQATKQMQETQMSFNLQYLQLQSQMQNDNRQFTMVSNIMKTKHDTVKNSISNIR